MPNGGGHGTDPGGWIGWVVAGLSAVGTVGASVWAWLERQRSRARTRKKSEAAEIAVPFKTLFEELQTKLKTVQTGFEQLQRDHIEERVKAARFETEATLLRAEVAELRSRLEGHGA
jgi:mannose/fructose/N-acetylgalactosamine-specific phosphotransferase system component IIC